MKIEVKLFAGFRKYVPDKSIEKDQAGRANSFVMDVPHGSKVGDITSSLGIPKDSKKIIFINGVHGDQETTLKENDRVGIFPPVAGG
jgi:molybdopterin converting factor small subunit